MQLKCQWRGFERYFEINVFSVDLILMILSSYYDDPMVRENGDYPTALEYGTFSYETELTFIWNCIIRYISKLIVDSSGLYSYTMKFQLIFMQKLFKLC